MAGLAYRAERAAFVLSAATAARWFSGVHGRVGSLPDRVDPTPCPLKHRRALARDRPDRTGKDRVRRRRIAGFGSALASSASARAIEARHRHGFVMAGNPRPRPGGSGGSISKADGSRETKKGNVGWQAGNVRAGGCRTNDG